MSLKPILFNTEMVRALLEDRKTVTRRVMKPQPVLDGHLWKLGGAAWNDSVLSVPVMFGHSLYNRAPYQPGDVLWVRETWCEKMGRRGEYLYRAYAGERDDTRDYVISHNTWRPSIHMPREAARIFLRVTGVRVERLQAITEEDAKAEGACKAYPYTDPEIGKTTYMQDENATYIGGFVCAWDNTIKSADCATCGWEANPWVWVIEFERIEKELVK